MRPIPPSTTPFRTPEPAKIPADDRGIIPTRSARKVAAAPPHLQVDNTASQRLTNNRAPWKVPVAAPQKEQPQNDDKPSSIPFTNSRKLAAQPLRKNPPPGNDHTISSPSDNDLPQLRQIKKNWDVSTVPRGNVMDRIKIFGGGDPGSKKDFLEEDLTNTGKTNPALRKRREMEREEELRRLKELEEEAKRGVKKNGFARTISGTKKAATAIQSVVRMYFAKKIALRRVDQAIAKVEREYRLMMEKDELQREEQAATKIQAIARGSLTRVRVCRIVDKMIADLLEQSQRVFSESVAAFPDVEQPVHSEQPGAAPEIPEEKDEEVTKDAPIHEAIPEEKNEEVAQDVMHEAIPEEKDEEVAQEEEEEKENAAEERRRKIEEEAALGRANREKIAEELAREKAEAEAQAEADRLAKVESAKASKEAAAAERERRLKNLNLFVGPLPWGVGLLPDWWMDETPHNTLQLDVITEDDNGEDFEEWRNVNLTVDLVGAT